MPCALWRMRLVLLVLVAWSAALGHATAQSAHSQSVLAPSATVTVDFARPLPATRSVVGLLHGLQASAPASRWIDPLRPALWRGSLFSAPFQRAAETGARYMLVVSDLWGYPGEGWRGRRPPWTDLDAWSDFVSGLAETAPATDVIWDIWNEPDNPYFWDGTEEQYLDTFVRAEEAIRRVLGPSAEIAGPSTSAFRPYWLSALAERCLLARCEVNVLTWHELPAGRSSIASIRDHLRLARRWLVDSPAYAPVGLRAIVINEVVGAADQLFPGELAGYYYALERGGADAAALACWRDPCGVDNCTSPSLDGLLDPRTLRPRATWWVVKAYADGVGARVWSRSSRTSLVTLASRRSVDCSRAEILLGYFDTHDGTATQRIDVRIALRRLDHVPRLRQARALVVHRARIPATGEDPVTPLFCRLPSLVRVRDGSAVLTVHGLSLHEALVIGLSRASASQERSSGR
jgi:hypothetical protein